MVPIMHACTWRAHTNTFMFTLWVCSHTFSVLIVTLNIQTLCRLQRISNSNSWIIILGINIWRKLHIIAACGMWEIHCPTSDTLCINQPNLLSLSVVKIVQPTKPKFPSSPQPESFIAFYVLHVAENRNLGFEGSIIFTTDNYSSFTSQCQSTFEDS